MYQIACRTVPGVTRWYLPNGSGVPDDNAESGVYQLSQGNTGLAILYVSASSISNGTFTMGQYSCTAVGHIMGYIDLYFSGKGTLMFLLRMSCHR